MLAREVSRTSRAPSTGTSSESLKTGTESVNGEPYGGRHQPAAQSSIWNGILPNRILRTLAVYHLCAGRRLSRTANFTPKNKAEEVISPMQQNSCKRISRLVAPENLCIRQRARPPTRFQLLGAVPVTSRRASCSARVPSRSEMPTARLRAPGDEPLLANCLFGLGDAKRSYEGERFSLAGTDVARLEKPPADRRVSALGWPAT